MVEEREDRDMLEYWLASRLNTQLGECLLALTTGCVVCTYFYLIYFVPFPCPFPFPFPSMFYLCILYSSDDDYYVIVTRTLFVVNRGLLFGYLVPS